MRRATALYAQRCCASRGTSIADAVVQEDDLIAGRTLLQQDAGEDEDLTRSAAMSDAQAFPFLGQLLPPPEG